MAYTEMVERAMTMTKKNRKKAAISGLMLIGAGLMYLIPNSLVIIMAISALVGCGTIIWVVYAGIRVLEKLIRRK